MTLTSNAHVHTNWCDGFNTAEEMVLAAIKLRFTDLGFSSHSSAPFDPSSPGLINPEGYRNEIAELKQKYEGRISILCGLEQDVNSEKEMEKYDYIILSAHYLPVVEGNHDSIDHNPRRLDEIIKERYSNNSIALAREYFSHLTQGVKQYKPDIVGHFDVITKFNKESRIFDEQSKEYQDAALTYLDEIIDCINDYGGMIEINTSGIRYKWTGYPYAGSPFILSRILAKKARIIITGDSHEIGMLKYKFPEALEMIKAAGFSSMTVLKNGSFVDVNI